MSPKKSVYLIKSGEKTDAILESRIFSDWMVDDSGEDLRIVCIIEEDLVDRLQPFDVEVVPIFSL